MKNDFMTYLIPVLLAIPAFVLLRDNLNVFWAVLLLMWGNNISFATVMKEELNSKKEVSNESK